MDYNVGDLVWIFIPIRKVGLSEKLMKRTISRRLVANGLHSCRPLRRLPLIPPNRGQRLEWCRARSTWMTEWHRVVFSDESRFCLSSDSRRVRVWRRRGERSNPAAIVERPTVRQRGIMVWGAIAYDSRSPLLRIQGTMTAQRYVDDVLRPVTLPYLQGVPNALYQQDNARPHTARISQQALQDVQMLPWPPYSPDLSPIEHVWDIIGRRLHALPQPRSEDELWQMVLASNVMCLNRLPVSAIPLAVFLFLATFPHVTNGFLDSYYGPQSRSDSTCYYEGSHHQCTFFLMCMLSGGSAVGRCGSSLLSTCCVTAPSRRAPASSYLQSVPAPSSVSRPHDSISQRSMRSDIDSFQEKPPKKTTAIFLDMTSAFDRVWREKLREKLHNIGNYQKTKHSEKAMWNKLGSKTQNSQNNIYHLKKADNGICNTGLGSLKLITKTCLGKVLDSLLSQRLKHWLESNELLSSFQHGFREGKSTTTALNEVLEGVEMGLNKGAWVLFVALDIDGAFNSMNWNKLMGNLMDMGCPDNLCSLVRDFLRDRRISLSFGGRKLERNCARGCPQGSCCGPILWNILVNTVFQEDLPEGARLVLYADDHRAGCDQGRPQSVCREELQPGPPLFRLYVGPRRHQSGERATRASNNPGAGDDDAGSGAPLV
ncbi:hypothetical protein LAZ67_10002942 [Cordylochernes scorpioides]|uniref:Reverse transcriptase domain-containing protein n=1 Tax=Cordylochernes scorpioides TaxID=51811 RepID=A0ABY6KWX4_9ARAC|nr:hypothetical protein LAZ67_10002942 [Cordylochernes scorpioides]